MPNIINYKQRQKLKEKIVKIIAAICRDVAKAHPEYNSGPFLSSFTKRLTGYMASDDFIESITALTKQELVTFPCSKSDMYCKNGVSIADKI